jgi:hypothetical protein
MSRDTYQSVEEFAKYHAENDDQNSQIIAGLVEHCTEVNIKETILHYSTEKDTSTIRKELNKVDLNTLKNTADFLGLPSDYKTANVITTKIVNKLTALMRCICGACSGYYNAGDTASLFCSKCTRPCHDECYKDAQESLKPGITLIFTCYQCTKKAETVEKTGTGEKTESHETETADTTEAELQTQHEPQTSSSSEQPKHPVIKVIESYNLDILYASNPQPNYPVCELYRKGLCPHGQEGLDEVAGELCNKLHPKTFTLNSHGNDLANDGNEVQRSEDQRPMCRFFLRSRCKHGISGQECRFQHMKVCRKFLNNGRHRQYGCNKGQSCENFHVKMCYSSLNERVCVKQDCRFHHLRGTRRYEEHQNSHEHQVHKNSENSSSHENRTSQSATNAWNPPTENPFLLITKQLSAQFAEMQRQQSFILNTIQMSNPHQLQPPQQMPNPLQPQPSQHVPPNLLPSQVHRAEQKDIPTCHSQMQPISTLNQNTPHQPQGVQQVYYIPNPV